LATACRGVLRVPATVFVPSIASAVKVARLRDYGADVHVVGTEYSHAASAAADFARVRGALASHAYDLPEVVAGAGTLALEVLEDEPAIDTIVVAVGGGGLFAGIAAAVDGRARIVAVSRLWRQHLPPGCRAAGRYRGLGVAADRWVPGRWVVAFAMATASPPISLLVDDEEILRARDLMWRTASPRSRRPRSIRRVDWRCPPPRPTARRLIVCGANTDPATR
jgi:threonine dehydratase